MLVYEMKHPTEKQKRATLWTKRITKSYLQRQAENIFDGAVGWAIFWFSVKLVKFLPGAKPLVMNLIKLL